jgi:tight adherence protein C
MLEVIALGMRSGLAFDAAFALYVHRFATPLAVVCRERFDVWEKGLMPREQGLKELARVVDVPIFARFAATASRALSYGAPMTRLLLELAAEARKAYRLEQQEAVAKAPVKMLLPTGALILPAMLLLVIGPILMDLLERMV